MRTTRYEAAVQAANEAAQWASTALAYARPDGTHIVVDEEHQNGEWVYRACRFGPADGPYGDGSPERRTFTRRKRATGQGLKQLAGKAFKG